MGTPGWAVGGDYHPHRVRHYRPGGGDAARRVQLFWLRPVWVSGCRRWPDRQLHSVGGGDLCVYRDRPRRRRFLRILRDHQGRGQSGGIGRRRFQHTGRPTANSDTHSRAYANTNPGAYADTDANTNSGAYTDTHSNADANPDTRADARAHADARSDIDANAATDGHGDAGADHRADAGSRSHALADANRHLGARTDGRPHPHSAVAFG